MITLNEYWLYIVLHLNWIINKSKNFVISVKIDKNKNPIGQSYEQMTFFTDTPV